MQSDLSIPTLTCPTHLDELIIRVSLQDKEKQLFYCYECIKQKERPELIKIQDLLPQLEKKYLESSSKASGGSLPKEAEDFIDRKKEIQMGFAEQVNESKLKADEEVNKMQKEMGKLLQTVRGSVDEKLDVYEEEFNRIFNEYNDSIKAYEDLLSSCEKPLPSQEELNKRIFSTSSSEEAEKNLKNVLEEIKARSELKEGVLLKNIEKTKKMLEKGKESVFRIPEKNQEEYELRLKPLQIYLEALICQSKEEPTTSENQSNITKQKEISQDLCKVFEKLNKTLEDSNSRIKKIFEDKFGVKKLVTLCSATKDGLTPTTGHAYRCITCIQKYRDIRQTDFVCEGCRESCHEGHQLEVLGIQDFVCQCQFTMRECKLATGCTFSLTGKSYVRQTYFTCRTDNMSSRHCICSFCANNCHKGHTIAHMNTGTAYCDCPEVFSFCKHNQQS